MSRVQRRRFSKHFGVAGLLASGIFVVGLLVGCGGFFPGANQITALTISPLSATLQPGATQQYSATATFGNNTQGDATSQVTWSSSSTNIATISSTGLATAGSTFGTTTIKAQSGSVIAATGLRVSNKTITSITISPQNPTMTSGTSQQFTATATFSDGTTGDVTTSVTWTSSSTSVATISSSGFVSAITTGTTTITATSGGISGTTQLTVQ